MNEMVYVVTVEDRTGNADFPTSIMGIFKNEVEAHSAILFSIFSSEGRLVIEGRETDLEEESFVTDSCAWKISAYTIGRIY